MKKEEKKDDKKEEGTALASDCDKCKKGEEKKEEGTLAGKCKDGECDKDKEEGTLAGKCKDGEECLCSTPDKQSEFLKAWRAIRASTPTPRSAMPRSRWA